MISKMIHRALLATTLLAGALGGGTRVARAGCPANCTGTNCMMSDACWVVFCFSDQCPPDVEDYTRSWYYVMTCTQGPSPCAGASIAGTFEDTPCGCDVT